MTTSSRSPRRSERGSSPAIGTRSTSRIPFLSWRRATASPAECGRRLTSRSASRFRHTTGTRASHLVWLTVGMPFTAVHAREIAAALELDVHATGVCLACLCIVSFAIDEGDERQIRSETFAMAPDLWHDGLALPLQASLERARRTGVPHAEEAIDDVARRGHRSPVVRAAIRKLAQQLLSEMRRDRAQQADVIPIGRDRGG
jgi:Arc/MetJ-type ribon-helix-helix transcriptional regulator